MSASPDLALLLRARAGDARATEQLLARHELRIYRYGMRMCGNEADARDVLQETLLAAFRNLAAFRGESQLSTWLFQIARSYCIKQRRRRGGEPVEHEAVDTEEVGRVPSEAAPGDDRAHAREVGALLQAAMGTLQEDHREALVLRDVEGLSAEEAAEVVGLSVGALKSRLHRARMAMREQLSAVLEEGPGAAACPELAQELSAYAGAEIDQSACAAIEAHLGTCPRCAAACEALQRTVAMCRGLPGGEVPAPVKAAVRAALRRSAVG